MRMCFPATLRRCYNIGTCVSIVVLTMSSISKPHMSLQLINC